MLSGAVSRVTPMDEPAASEQATRAPDVAAPEPPAVAELSYEQARTELAGIVAALESGEAGLAESMTLWERGEALAAHCQRWLDRARQRLAEAPGTAGDDRP